MTGFQPTEFSNPQFDHGAVHRHGHAPVRYGGADDALYVVFYERAVELGFASEQAGRPIHEMRTYVKMVAPGSNGKTINDREANASDKQRFPRHWAAYQENKKDPQIIGTPLSSCTFIDRALAEDFRAVGIHTAEQLASLDDGMLQRLGPGYRQHKAKAAAYCEEATKQAPLMRLAAENDAQKQQIANLSAANAEMMRRLEVLERTQLYQQPQQPPPHVQEQIEREVDIPREKRPFFSPDQIPDPSAAYREHAMAPSPPFQAAPKPRAAKKRRAHRRTKPSKPTPAEPATQEI